MEQLGFRIRKRREELEMSQEELAAKTGYKSRQGIQAIECGRTSLPSRKIPIMSKALQVTDEWLMGFESINHADDEKAIAKIIRTSTQTELISYAIRLLVAANEKNGAGE